MDAKKDPLEVLRDTFEQSAIWAAALTSARSAPEMERFATWVMGITGAAFGLLIANLDKFVALVSAVVTGLTMLMMLLSAYFGFVARFQAYQVKIYVNLHDDKNLELRQAYAAEGGQLELRMEKIDEAVLRIISPDIDELSWFGRIMWGLVDWLIGLPAPKPNLDGVPEAYQGVKETAFKAGAVLRCVIWQMFCLFAAVLTSSTALLWHWAATRSPADPWAAWAAKWAAGGQ
jgi:hypothetical protein